MNRKAIPKTGHSKRAREDAFYQHIGQKIRGQREARGWSQGNLAAELSVAANTVSRWETGAYKPSAAELDRMARLFDVEIWAFLPSSAKPPTEAQRALLSATGDLPEEDLAELERYAGFIRGRKAMQDAKNKRRKRNT